MILAIDTETTGSDWWHGCRPFFVSACDDLDNRYCWEWPVDPVTRQPDLSKPDVRIIRELIRNADRIVMHNANFDLRMLSTFLPEDEVSSIWLRLDDTLLASHVLHNDWRHGLKHLCEILLSFPSTDEIHLQRITNKARGIARRHFPTWRIANRADPHFPGLKSPADGWWVLDTWLPKAIYDTDYGLGDDVEDFRSALRTYAVFDAERTMTLYQFLRQALEEEGLIPIYRQRLELLQIVYDMETRGVLLSPGRLEEQVRFHSTAAEQAAARCLELKDINLNSSLQLGKLLYEDLGFVSRFTEKGNYRTDQATLTELIPSAKSPIANRFLNSLVLSRKHQKSCDYLESYSAWAANGVLHSQLNITGTKFTRQSSTNPNLQNVGTGKGDETHNLRVVFVPRPGHVFITVDYSNLELRIWAYSCGNQDLIDAFENNISVHLVIACELHPSLLDMDEKDAKETAGYKMTKNGNFALIYGAGRAQADKTYGIPGAYDRLANRFPEIPNFTRRLHKRFIRDGYIETLGGYRLSVPADEPHKVVSAFVQGTAGDIIAQAMRDVSAITDTLRLQIHDELVFEVPEYEVGLADDICRVMCATGPQFGIPTPVSCTIRPISWGE